MRWTRPLLLAYLALLGLAGVACLTEPDLFLAGWLPFAGTLGLFAAGARARARAGQIVAAVVLALGTAGVVWAMLLAGIDLCDRRWPFVGNGDGVRILLLAAPLLFSAVTIRQFVRLLRERGAEGFFTMLRASTLATLATGAIAGGSLIAMPPRPEIFLDGIVSFLALLAAGTWLAFLVGAWILAALPRRAEPPEISLPEAKIVR